MTKLAEGQIAVGGIAASAHFVIVERNRWLDQKEFVELFGERGLVRGRTLACQGAAATSTGGTARFAASRTSAATGGRSSCPMGRANAG